MGYFANGLEGETYQDRYCSKCKRNGDCPIWDAHQMFNYDDCNNDKSVLHFFIPRDEQGNNKKCCFFRDKNEAT